ncbi:hypothetical protein Hanom_Chr03g00202611 [Helianthus anomalus]
MEIVLVQSGLPEPKEYHDLNLGPTFPSQFHPDDANLGFLAPRQHEHIQIRPHCCYTTLRAPLDCLVLSLRLAGKT